MHSIHDRDGADAAAAELKTLGELILGLLSDTQSLHLSAEQSQIINTKIAEILACNDVLKRKQYYGSRLLMAAYDSMMLATQTSPTDEEIASNTERIRKEYEKLSLILPTITDRESADAAGLAYLIFNKSVHLAWDAGLISDTLLQELMQQKAPTEEDVKHIKRIKAADFYGSQLLRAGIER